MRFESKLENLPLGLLASLGSAAAAFWVFIEIADEVLEGDTRELDEQLLLALRVPGAPSDPLGPAWLEEMARDLTALGSFGVLAFLSIAAVGYLLLAGKRHAAILTFLSVAGGQALSSVLKLGFARPRPDLVPHAAETFTASFPSGHSMMAAVTYLTLGALLARMEASLTMRLYLLALAGALAAVVGVTRVYLGVHWPSDVLGGWAAGGAWASACWLVSERLQRRGQVEPPGVP